MITKVVSIDGVREWDGPNGTVFYIKMTMENGDIVSIGKKNKEAFKVGDSIDYSVESTDEYGVKKIKENKEAFGGKGGGYSRDYKKESVTMCLSYAKDLIIAGKAEPKDLIGTAERFHKRVLDQLEKC